MGDLFRGFLKMPVTSSVEVRVAISYTAQRVVIDSAPCSTVYAFDCCGVFQCVSVCCGVLRCTAVCCGVFPLNESVIVSQEDNKCASGCAILWSSGVCYLQASDNDDACIQLLDEWVLNQLMCLMQDCMHLSRQPKTISGAQVGMLFAGTEKAERGRNSSFFWKCFDPNFNSLLWKCFDPNFDDICN